MCLISMIHYQKPEKNDHRETSSIILYIVKNFKDYFLNIFILTFDTIVLSILTCFHFCD